MLNPDTFREVVSGRRGGLAASVMRAALGAAELPYTLAVNWRNRRYDRERAAVHRAGVPVISVGNLTLGGTGKTPLVKWLARWLCERKVRVAIVSRGYGAKAGRANDEALELHQALPDVPHVQDADRVAGAQRAVAEFGAQVILLDDGFQHRRLGRDLDIVLLDALEPFGFDHVFPRGTLREPIAGLRRAQVVCLSRADVIGASQRESLRRRVEAVAPRAVWCELAHAPSALINASGQSQPLDVLRGARVVAFCGIGNPAGFRHTLEATGCELAAWKVFADHHAYSAADIVELERMAVEIRAEMFLCTQKDLVKLQREQIGDLPLWAVAIEMRILSGQQELEAKVAGSLREP